MPKPNSILSYFSKTPKSDKTGGDKVLSPRVNKKSPDVAAKSTPKTTKSKIFLE